MVILALFPGSPTHKRKIKMLPLFLAILCSSCPQMKLATSTQGILCLCICPYNIYMWMVHITRRSKVSGQNTRMSSTTFFSSKWLLVWRNLAYVLFSFSIDWRSSYRREQKFGFTRFWYVGFCTLDILKCRGQQEWTLWNKSWRSLVPTLSHSDATGVRGWEQG